MNNVKFLNDDELGKLDRYKSVNLLKSLNECNTYVQNGAIITMLDVNRGNLHAINRGTGALAEVMDYVNRCSIPREALIEVIYNLFQYTNQHNFDTNSNEFQKLSFTVGILQELLLENTYFKIYKCKKGFTPKSKLNGDNFKVKRGNILYYLDRNVYKQKQTSEYIELNVLFDVFDGNWLYISDDEMLYLKQEHINGICNKD